VQAKTINTTTAPIAINTPFAAIAKGSTQQLLPIVPNSKIINKKFKKPLINIHHQPSN